MTFIWFSCVLCLCLGRVFSEFVVESMEVIACNNNLWCWEGKSLQIVANASVIEESPGMGSITGIVTAQTWTDSFGSWELVNPLSIALDYNQAQWNYQLIQEGEFFTKFESSCGGALASCTTQSNYVICPNLANNGGLYLSNAMPCTKYSFNTVEKWQSSFSAVSNDINYSYAGSDIQYTSSNSDIKVTLDSHFTTSSCFKNLTDDYFVTVPNFGNQNYYFTSKQYWQDDRNNLNLSTETWRNNFDCNFTWPGWHVVIPFYETSTEYSSNGMSLSTLSSNQLGAWSNGYFDAFYYDVMDIPSGNCVNLMQANGNWTSSSLNNMGQPADDTYKVTTLGIVDHFQITIEASIPALLRVPTVSPTENPTGVPSINPSANPSLNPSIPPTSHPSKAPSRSPISSFSIFDAYQTPATINIITTSTQLNMSSIQVQSNIRQSIASALNIGREHVRLDNYHVSSSTRRRLQTTYDTEIDFTVFTFSAANQSIISNELSETATYSAIYTSLSGSISGLSSVLVSAAPNTCPAGTKTVNIAGNQKCHSICGHNEIYNISTSSCQAIIRESIRQHRETTSGSSQDWGMRIGLFFAGMASWAVIALLIKHSNKCCKSNNSVITSPKTKSKPTTIKRKISSDNYAIDAQRAQSLVVNTEELENKNSRKGTRGTRGNTGNKSGESSGSITESTSSATTRSSSTNETESS